MYISVFYRTDWVSGYMGYQAIVDIQMVFT